MEVAARAQKWVDQALSRNIYLESRDIENMMGVYLNAWKKGLKTTYYLHMKPRHTAEQSTVRINKREALGRVGFGAIAEAGREVIVAGGEEGGAKVCPIDPAEREQCDSCQ